MKSIKLAFSTLLLWSSVASAQDISLGGHLAVVSNDGPSGSDFDESVRLEGFVIKPVTPNLSFEAGLAQTTETETSDEDNTGSYRLSISSTDVFAGARLETNAFNNLTLFGRAGALYYNSDIEFKESFFGLKPGGTVEEVEEGTGYYIGGGLALTLNKQLKLEAELTHRKREDYFEDSSASFDMESLGLAVGVVFIPF